MWETWRHLAVRIQVDLKHLSKPSRVVETLQGYLCDLAALGRAIHKTRVEELKEPGGKPGLQQDGRDLVGGAWVRWGWSREPVVGCKGETKWA